MTPMQKKTLDFIKAKIDETGGISPSFAEIADGIGVSSKSTIHRLVWALHEMGEIHIAADRARRITVARPGKVAEQAIALIEVRVVAAALLSGRISKRDAAQKLIVLADKA